MSAVAGVRTRDLWLHSVTVAGASRMLAVRARTGAGEDAFLAGLIHDVGHIVELHADRARLATLVKQLSTDNAADLIDAEDLCFSANHQDFGFALTERWNLPPALTASTATHHRPLQADTDHRTLATVVHIADRLALHHCPGYPLDVRRGEIADDALDALRLTRSELQTVAEQLPAIADEAARYLTG